MAALSGARLIALTCSDDDAVRDPIIMAGVVGIVSKRASPDVLLHAIESVHGGEVWIDRRAIGRIFHDLSRKSRGDGHPLLHGLTAKERIVVEQIQVCPSAPNRMLADRLHISENTLRNHLTSIYAKLGLASRAELQALLNGKGSKPAQ
jgi:DNA-binding NarL/FixJ family response regulator